jgi:hypothetical protein
MILKGEGQPAQLAQTRRRPKPPPPPPPSKCVSQLSSRRIPAWHDHPEGGGGGMSISRGSRNVVVRRIPSRPSFRPTNSQRFSRVRASSSISDTAHTRSYGSFDHFLPSGNIIGTDDTGHQTHTPNLGRRQPPIPCQRPTQPDHKRAKGFSKTPRPSQIPPQQTQLSPPLLLPEAFSSADSVLSTHEGSAHFNRRLSLHLVLGPQE